MIAYRQCPKRGCAGLYDGKACTVCGEFSTQRTDSRPSSRARGYDKRKWRELRNQKINQQQWCERCERDGRSVRATVAHHLDPVEQGNPVLCELGRLESLCRECHDREHGRKR